MLYRKNQIVVAYGFIGKVLETPKFEGNFYKVLPVGHNYGDYRYVPESKIHIFEDIDE